MKPRILYLVAACALAALLWSGWGDARAAEEAQPARPVLLYSLYFNAKGENRYAPDGVYSELLNRLKQDFEVRVNDAPLTGRALAGVKVVLIANPNDKASGANPPPAHVTPREVRSLNRFVKRGGGLILMENQDNHNVEVDDSNRLLAQFGIRATNVYTGVKKLVLPNTTPIIGGLRWAYYSGNLLLVNETHPAKPAGLVTNDLAVKTINGGPDQEGVLLATAEPSKGRVVVVTDSGWVANWAFDETGAGGNAVKGQDNWEIFRRLARWSAHLPP